VVRRPASSPSGISSASESPRAWWRFWGAPGSVVIESHGSAQAHHDKPREARYPDGGRCAEEPGYQAICNGSLPATGGSARVAIPRCNEGPGIARALLLERREFELYVHK
jgi:hypothetical protein